MLDRLVKAFLGASLAAAFCMPVSFAQDAAAPKESAQPKVKDQGEYDALTAAQKEADPVKKLALLKVWQDKYPDSEFKNQRLLAFMNTWSQIAAKTLQSAPTPESLAAGKEAAQNLLDNLDKAFAPEMKPSAVTDDQWKTAKSQVEQQAHITLGWVAWQGKDYAASETEFKKALQLNDQNAQVSYWLGSVIISERKVERTPEALYSFARSVVVSGPGALPDKAKQTADQYLAKAWKNYHGDDDPKGLQDLKDMAAKSALPPDDIDKTIKSVVEREKEKSGSEEAYLKDHPDIALWRNLKAAFIAPDGQDYFDKNVKGTIIPQTFKAKIVSMTPDPNPTELKVAIDDVNGDAVIKFEKPIKGKIDVGTVLDLNGNPETFTKDPFMVTFNGDESKIKGLPAPPAKVAPHHPTHRKS